MDIFSLGAGKGSSDLLAMGKGKEVCGIICGKRGKTICYSPTSKEAHVFVQASSGAGKTSAILLPSLISFCKDPNAAGSYTIDVSSDILAASVSRIQNLQVFDPFYSTRSEKITAYYQPKAWNVFEKIDSLATDNEKTMELRNLANLILPKLNNEGSNATYFHNGGMRILQAALIAFYFQGLDFCEIMQKIVSLDYAKLFREIDSSKNQDAINLINGFAGNNEANISGCYDVASSSAAFFAMQAVAEQFHRPNGSADSCLSPSVVEDQHLIVCLRDEMLSVWAPALSLITGQTLSYFASRPDSMRKRKILFLLDEYASLRLTVDQISQAAQKYRKCGIRIVIFIQSLNSLFVLYGHDATAAMLDNFKLQICMGTEDPATAEYFSKKIGKEHKRGGFLDYMTENKSRINAMPLEWIVPPEEFMALRRECIVVFPGGYRRLRNAFYFEN